MTCLIGERRKIVSQIRVVPKNDALVGSLEHKQENMGIKKEEKNSHTAD